MDWGPRTPSSEDSRITRERRRKGAAGLPAESPVPVTCVALRAVPGTAGLAVS